MAVTPIVRGLSRHMNVFELKATQGYKLYDSYARTLGTEDLKIVIAAGTYYPATGKFVSGRDVEVKRDARYLDELLPSGTEEAQLQVSAVYGRNGLDPNEKLTRRELIFEILRMWDFMLTKLPKEATAAKPEELTQDDLIKAKDVLMHTYKLEELMDTWATPDGDTLKPWTLPELIDTINVPTIKQLTAGPTDVFALGDWNFEQEGQRDLWAV